MNREIIPGRKKLVRQCPVQSVHIILKIIRYIFIILFTL